MDVDIKTSYIEKMQLVCNNSIPAVIVHSMPMMRIYDSQLKPILHNHCKKRHPLLPVYLRYYDRPPNSSSSSKKKSSSDIRVTSAALSADFRLAEGDSGATSNSVSPPSRE
jgi:hypothetical protein